MPALPARVLLHQSPLPAANALDTLTPFSLSYRGGAPFHLLTELAPAVTEFGTSGFACRREVACIQTARANARAAQAWLLVLLLLATGCSGDRWISMRGVPQNPLSQRLKMGRWGAPQPSERTATVLRRYSLGKEFEENPDAALGQLHGHIDRDASPDTVYAFAEAAYLTGKQLEARNPEAALDYYCAAVTHAYLYLFDPRYYLKRNPYDPQYRAACDLYNGSLECTLRLWQQDGGMRQEHTVRTARQFWDIQVVTRSGRWGLEDFQEIKFASDYEVKGFNQRYETFGLGVPLIGIRKTTEGQTGDDKYYPPIVSTPVTAFLKICPAEAAPAANGEAKPSRHKVLLELYDPLAGCDILVNGVRVPLESDLTTPLAYFLQQSSLESFANLGFFSPDRWEDQTGLYFTEPYDPQKIPVVFVHGLWSSPSTWSEMLNDLRGAPDVRDKYQFWFYLYPTGQPFWFSAAQMRQDLRDMRQVFDPQLRTPTLDQLVLVGHSMGGLVSKLQTVEGGEAYWSAISDTPFQLVKASDEVKQQIENTFFFQPNPAVRRVVTIASPHQGSHYSNGATRWLSSKVISLPSAMVSNYQQLFQDNPDILRTGGSRSLTSIDSLSPSSPLLPILYNSAKPAWVTYNNIVGNGKSDGDGIVSLVSSHVENAESEKVVETDHNTIHRHPETILEVQRILALHAERAQREMRPKLPPRRDRVLTTSGPAGLPLLGPPLP